MAKNASFNVNSKQDSISFAKYHTVIAETVDLAAMTTQNS